MIKLRFMIKVLDAGFFTTIQDSGRFGFRNKGVPVAGTMDDVSAERANNLLENKPSDTLLEITMKGPKLAFEKPSYICLSGAILSAFAGLSIMIRTVSILE